MLCLFGDMWLAGTWYPPSSPSTGTVKDINGHLLNVGDVVNLTGVITAIQQISLTTGNITVQLSHPGDAVNPAINVGGVSLIAVYVSGP